MDLRRDVVHAVRGFRRHPGLVLIGSLSLALGIAVNVAMFTGVNTLLWRPLDYPESDRLVQLWQTNPSRGWDRSSLSVPALLEWRRGSRTMAITGYSGASFNFSEGDQPERLTGLRVSPGFLGVLGVTVAFGRGFLPADEVPGTGRVVLLRHQLWTRRFDADSSVIGRTVRLDGEPHEVVGVLRPEFRFDGEAPVDVLVPLIADPAASRRDWFLRAIGRLRDGTTLAEADAEIKRVAERFEADGGSGMTGLSARAMPMLDEVIEEQPRRAGTITMVAVAFVLLIACANVANLLLARATGRDRELAVRSALGADRRRLIRELLTESLVLAGIGGLLAIPFSYLGVGWLRSVIPADFPRMDLLRLDWTSFGFAAAITTLAGLAFGIAPAWRSSRPNLVGSLREGGRGLTGLRHGRVLASLVGLEVALALALLIAAGLLIKASVRIAATPAGFEAAGRLAFRTSLAEREYPDSAAVVRFQERLRRRLLEEPGVTAVAAVSQLPFDGGSGTYYRLEGDPDATTGQGKVTQLRGITPGYLGTLGVALRQGRDLSEDDRFESPRVAIVNEAFVGRNWADGRALGRRVEMFGQWWEVVGVAADVREFGPDEPAPPTVFVSASQRVNRRMSYVLRTDGDPAAMAPAARAVVRELAPTQPIYDVETLESHVTHALAESSIMPQLLGVFGAMALVMAVIGVYGVMAYSVAQRTQELGIRRALGAPDRQLSGLVLRQAAVVTGIGGLAGLGLAAATSKALSFFLFGVSAFDPTVFIGVTVALLATALGACAIPARRASRVDPMVALRDGGTGG